MNDTILGYCGLYCGECLVFQNTAKGLKTELDPGVAVTCGGCNSQELTPWCTDCTIKNCCRGKGIRYCQLCSEYPCGIITEFINNSKYPYHKRVPESMQRLTQIGFDAWQEEEENRTKCSGCGKKVNWFEEKCTICGCERAKD